MSENCEQGKEYKCPYMEWCEYDLGNIDYRATNIPLKASSIRDFFVGIKEPDKTKTWTNEGRVIRKIYACKPIKSKRG